MSIRAYRLLRNNQEQGPFTAEEIIQKGLKPYDLIWMDGRSAAWSYPGEIAEFKIYAPLPGEEVSTIQINKQQSTNAISPSVQAAVAMNNAIAGSSATQKPRYKVSAAWSKIQTITAPVYKSPMVSEAQKTALKNKATLTQVDANNSKSLSWKEAWLDWEKEKTDVPVVVPVKPATVPSSKKKNITENYAAAPVLETKYSEPLDSLKDKYIDNILLQKQKTKKGFSLGKGSEFIIPTLALLIIFSAAYWLMHGNNETAAALSNTSQKKIVTIPSTNTDSLAINNNPPANVVASNAKYQEQKNIPSSIKTSTDQAEERKPVYAAKPVEKKNNNEAVQNNVSATASKKRVGQPSSKQTDAAVINNVPANNTTALNTDENNPTRHRTYNIDDNSNNSSTQKNIPVITKPVVIKKTVANYINVPEYVEMKDGSANLKIQNISDVNLDLVVVDVQYFDASNRFRKGETLYLHNLKAGKNITVKTPKDLNSIYATSKISLISSDADNVNVIGDN